MIKLICKCSNEIDPESGFYILSARVCEKCYKTFMKEVAMQTPVNQIRQILMNELGLSRETIREEMVEIIKDTIKKHFNSGAVDSLMKDQIRNTVDNLLKENRYYSAGSTKDFIAGVVQARMKEIFNEVAKAMKGKVEVQLTLDFDEKKKS